MEINVSASEKMVKIWLSQAEKNNETLKASLRPVFKKYKEEKYIVAVFESGDKDLVEGTQSLLNHNRAKAL